jgi:hypothetical protein
MLEMAFEMLLTKRVLMSELNAVNKDPATPVESSSKLERLRMNSYVARDKLLDQL